MSDQQDNQPKKRRFFQRTRERIEEFEKTHEDVRGIIEHLDEHKEAYLAGAGCLVLGFLVGKHHRRATLIAPVFNTTIDATPSTSEAIETLAPFVEDKWNVLGLTTDELKTLLVDPEQHLHFESPNMGNLCVQHVSAFVDYSD